MILFGALHFRKVAYMVEHYPFTQFILLYLKACRYNNECIRVISGLKDKVRQKCDTQRILKQAKQFLAYSIANSINSSSAGRIFPACLKLACVTPVFKAGNRSDVSCYRLISVLPLFTKIFERCMANRLLSFITKYSTNISKQFGFQCGKSTLHALISLTEYICI